MNLYCLSQKIYSFIIFNWLIIFLTMAKDSRHLLALRTFVNYTQLFIILLVLRYYHILYIWLLELFNRSKRWSNNGLLWSNNFQQTLITKHLIILMTLTFPIFIIISNISHIQSHFIFSITFLCRKTRVINLRIYYRCSNQIRRYFHFCCKHILLYFWCGYFSFIVSIFITFLCI